MKRRGEGKAIGIDIERKFKSLLTQQFDITQSPTQSVCLQSILLSPSDTIRLTQSVLLSPSNTVRLTRWFMTSRGCDQKQK